MNLLRLREAGRQEVPLRPEDAWWLQESGAARCSASRRPGHFDVSVGNVTGVISNGEVTVEITPKIALGEFLWLLTYAATGVKLTPEEVQAAPTAVAEALAAVLVRLVGDAISGGLPRGYWEDEQSSPTLRGRLRLTDQVTQHLGRLYPLELMVSEFGVDIAENQIMRAACAHSLATLTAAGQPTTTRVQTQLQRLLRHFDGVCALPPGETLPTWRKTSQNARTWAALEFAEFILRGEGLDATHGNLTSSGLLIKTWRVFEAAVGRGLREARPEWEVRTQAVYPLVAGDGFLTMRPDLVVESHGRVVAVADTKYKAPDTRTDDLYQLFTYAHYLGLDRSHLIYASDPGAPRRLPVGGSGIEVVAHGLDLRRPSATLISQLESLADSFTGSSDLSVG